MRTSIRCTAIAVASICIALVAGCGGGGGGSNPGGGGQPPPVGYSGDYKGSIVTSNSDKNTTLFNIDQNNVILGNVKFVALPTSVALSGDITNTGVVSAHYTAQGSTYTVAGQLFKDASNPWHYTANLTVHNDTTGAILSSATLDVMRS